MKGKKILSLLLAALQISLLLALPMNAFAEEGSDIASGEKIKVACVGDSITEGIGVANPATDSYPAQLQAILGDGYEVGNFGVSKYAALHSAVWPYWETDKYTESQEFLPDIVVIMLGTNDIKTENWVEGKDNFVRDYTELINVYKNLSSQPDVFVVSPPPIYLDVNDEVRPPNNLRYEAIDLLKQAAEETDSYWIDVFTAMDNHPELFPDQIHPNEAGAKLLAQTVADGILHPTKLTPSWSDNLANLPELGDMEANLTREEFAMLIVNIFGLQADSARTRFVDIDGCTYKADIASAYVRGIIKGVDDTHFEPDGAITREEITVMLYRAWKVLFPDEDFTVTNTYEFVDAAEISDWAVEAVTYLYDRGIMVGTDTLTISPKINIPRKDALTLMTRIVESYEK
ncbi:MAG TPA: S-layer homology domain-containing protein [Candidatus Aphodoplasma excrementigallinarum]|uniref:S-layer homology domain-containing protein n=1 Tax=Candidatus Aphodoplasma excrementigallinarum TaxID=2840673 RepID=A0A9D1NHI5_9FIRM|nr:S-layer homology domain-containing protein [Candidatus Aphodoplasma excrementigallinarum]